MIEALTHMVRNAGSAILEIYNGDFKVQSKADATPLTAADLRAHSIIVDALRELAADTPVLSEEAEPPPFAERRRWRRYWLVDPLDGTKEFVSRNGEFTVNIALIEDGVPTVGVVGVPVADVVYVGDCRGGRASTAYRQDAHGRTPLRTRPMRSQAVTVVASRRHGGDRLARWLNALEERFDVSRKLVGSSLKLCILAAGEADIYPRLGPTSEWDIAAAHAVLAAAGGAVMQLNGAPLVYNAKESLLNPDFVAVADRSYPWPAELRRGM